MEITEVRIFPVDEDKLKAYVTITLDRCFVVRELKVIQGTTGLFVAMPAKRRKDGTFKDIAHPLNTETRERMERIILAEYDRELTRGPATPPGRRRRASPRLGHPARYKAPLMGNPNFYKVFAGNSNPALAKAVVQNLGRELSAASVGALLRRRDPGRDRRERPRARHLHHPVHRAPTPTTT